MLRVNDSESLVCLHVMQDFLELGSSENFNVQHNFCQPALHGWFREFGSFRLWLISRFGGLVVRKRKKI